MNDKEIYQTASDTLDKLFNSSAGKEKKARAEGLLDLDLEFQKKLMDAKQTASAEKKVGKIDKNGFRALNLPKSLKSAAGKVVGKVPGIKDGVTTAKKGAGDSAAKFDGKAVGKAWDEVIKAITDGEDPIQIAIKAIPVLQGFAGTGISEVAENTDKAMKEDLKETRDEREAVAKKVQELLLDSVSTKDTTDNLEERQKATKELIDKVLSSDGFKLSKPEDMAALQKQLADLATSYSPEIDKMSALKHYSTDEELVAGEFVFLS